MDLEILRLLTLSIIQPTFFKTNTHAFTVYFGFSPRAITFILKEVQPLLFAQLCLEGLAVMSKAFRHFNM